MYNKSSKMIVILALSFCMTSCIVSKKKYEEIENKRLACEFRENSLINEKQKLIQDSEAERAQLNKEIEKLNIQLESIIIDTVKLHSKNKEYNDLILAKISEKEKMGFLLDSKIKELDNKDTELRNKSEELANKNKELIVREKTINELNKIINDQKASVNNLHNKVKGALVNFDSDELTVKLENGMIYIALSDKLLFKSGSAEIEKKGKEAIGMLAEVLLKNPDIDIIIEGHTDSIDIKTSRFSDNWDLSVIRATSVVRILTEDYHIDPKQVIPSGRGKYFPVSTNKTSDGRAKNRRTEIILSPKLDELYKILEGK